MPSKKGNSKYAMYIHQIISILVPIQAFVIGLYFYKYLNKTLKIVLGFVFFAALTESTGQIIIHFFKSTNMWIGHFYVMIEFFFWSLFYWSLMKSYANRKMFWAIVLLFELYCTLNTIFFQDLNEYPITRSIEGILLVLFSIVFFHRIMIESKIEKLIKEPVVWINSAILFYFAVNVFFHLMFTILLEGDIEFLKDIITNFFITANALFYVALSVSFYLQKLKSK